MPQIIDAIKRAFPQLSEQEVMRIAILLLAQLGARALSSGSLTEQAIRFVLNHLPGNPTTDAPPPKR